MYRYVYVIMSIERSAINCCFERSNGKQISTTDIKELPLESVEDDRVGLEVSRGGIVGESSPESRERERKGIIPRIESCGNKNDLIQIVFE